MIVVKIDLYNSPQTLDQYWLTLVSIRLPRSRGWHTRDLLVVIYFLAQAVPETTRLLCPPVFYPIWTILRKIALGERVQTRRGF